MLFIDRSHVQLEPTASSPSTAGNPSGGSPAGSVRETPLMADDEFRERVLNVLESVLRDMERRGRL